MTAHGSAWLPLWSRHGLCDAVNCRVGWSVTTAAEAMPVRTSATARRRNSVEDGRDVDETTESKGQIFTLFQMIKSWSRTASRLNRQ